MKIQIVTNCWSRSISESDNVWSECLLKFLEGLGHHLSSLLDHRETQQASVEFRLNCAVLQVKLCENMLVTQPWLI